jgi:hypothetical protein
MQRPRPHLARAAPPEVVIRLSEAQSEKAFFLLQAAQAQAEALEAQAHIAALTHEAGPLTVRYEELHVFHPRHRLLDAAEDVELQVVEERLEAIWEEVSTLERDRSAAQARAWTLERRAKTAGQLRPALRVVEPQADAGGSDEEKEKPA